MFMALQTGQLRRIDVFRHFALVKWKPGAMDAEWQVMHEAVAEHSG